MVKLMKPPGGQGITGTTLWAAYLCVAVVFGMSIYLGRELLVLALVAGLAVGVMILRKPLYGLYLSFSLIPLEAAGRIVKTNSTFTWAKLVLILTLLGLLLNMLVQRSHLRAPRAVLSLYFVLLGALVGTTLWARLGNPVWGIVAFMGQAGMLLTSVNLVHTRREYENLIAAIMLGSVFVTGIGILDIVTKKSFLGTVDSQIYAAQTPGLFRVTATFYDPNMLGRYLAFAILVSVCSMRFARFKRWIPIIIGLLGAQAFVLMNTFSRGAILSLSGAFLLLVIWDRRVGRKVLILMSALFAGVVVALFAEPAVSAFMDRLTGGGKTLAVDLSRVVIYQLGVKAFWNSPFFGYGPDNVPDAIGQYFVYKVSPHSMYLEILLATGVVGTLAFGWFVLKHLSDGVALRRSPLSDYARPAVFALVVVLLAGVTLHGFKANELWSSLALLACVSSLARAEDPGPLEEISP